MAKKKVTPRLADEWVMMPNVCSGCPKRRVCDNTEQYACARFKRTFCSAWDQTVQKFRKLTGLEVKNEK